MLAANRRQFIKSLGAISAGLSLGIIYEPLFGKGFKNIPAQKRHTPKHDIIVGLDIGSTKIVAMIGKKIEYGKIEILGIGETKSTGVKRGIVTNISQTTDSIRTTIIEAEKQSGVTIVDVNVAFSGQHIDMLHHRSAYMRSIEEEIDQQDIDEIINDAYNLVMLPGEEIIHVFLHSYTVDGEQDIKIPIGMSCKKLESELDIITVQKAALNNISRSVGKTGLAVAEFILAPLASAEAVLWEEERDAGVALVDIGGGIVDMAIFYNNIVRHVAFIPFAGNVLTKNVLNAFSIEKNKAECLKIQFGSALASEEDENEIIFIPMLEDEKPKEISVKNIAHIIQARMEEIIDIVYDEIKEAGFKNKLEAGVVITGGGAQLKHISKLFELRTGLSTRVGYPERLLSKSAVEKVGSPEYSTAVGLVMNGFESYAR